MGSIIPWNNMISIGQSSFEIFENEFLLIWSSCFTHLESVSVFNSWP